MKKYFILVFILTVLFPRPAWSSDPESFLLFKTEAKAKLAVLAKSHAPDTLTMAILAHNIAFDDSTEVYLAMAKKLFSRVDQTDVVVAYVRALNIMEEREKSFFRKLRTKKSILAAIRNDYAEMATALTRHPTNDTLLFLNTGAAIEIGHLFPELLPDARQNLNTLWDVTDPNNRDQMFFLNLLEAKYHFKCGITTKDSRHFETAMSFMKKTRIYASNSHHSGEIYLWEKRIGKKLPKK